MPVTYKKIASVTVGAGGAASISFTSIPSTYTDLIIQMSARVSSGSDGTLYFDFNSSTANFSWRRLLGDGTSATSNSGSSNAVGVINRADWTASTFSNNSIYIPNYAGSTNKSFSVDAVLENNATATVQGFWAGLWSNTAAITSITFTNAANFAEYSTAVLYGISKS
jgi:hypothetical protein